jgi:hypothetical protein
VDFEKLLDHVLLEQSQEIDGNVFPVIYDTTGPREPAGTALNGIAKLFGLGS